MPTENRSSNTENAPCPFCGGQVDPEGWLRGDGVRGPECESCGATAPTIGVWNSVKPAEQHQGVPVAWIVVSPDDLEPVKGVAHTKEGAEQFKASGWAVTPLYTHADPAGDPTGSFDKHMEYMDRCHKLEKKLAEAHALLRELHAAFENDQHPWIPGGNAQPAKSKLDAFLYASAEPSTCQRCAGTGIWYPATGSNDRQRCPEGCAPVERDELKPCPFCGCQVTFLTGREDYRIAGRHSKTCPFLDVDLVVDSREAWQTRAALERNPS